MGTSHPTRFSDFNMGKRGEISGPIRGSAHRLFTDPSAMVFSLSVSGSIGRPPPLFLVSFAASFLYQFKCTSSSIQADYVHFFTLTLLLKATAKEGAVQRHVAFALLGAGRAQKLML